MNGIKLQTRVRAIAESPVAAAGPAFYSPCDQARDLPAFQQIAGVVRDGIWWGLAEPGITSPGLDSLLRAIGRKTSA